MSSVYKRGNKLWARLKDESGKWSCEATPFRTGQEVEARRYLKRLEARIAAARDVTDAAELAPGTPITWRSMRKNGSRIENPPTRVPQG